MPVCSDGIFSCVVRNKQEVVLTWTLVLWGSFFASPLGQPCACFDEMGACEFSFRFPLCFGFLRNTDSRVEINLFRDE